MALESIEIKDMCTDGGEELIFREVDQRFPDKVAAGRMEEAMEETFGLKTMRGFHWTIETCVHPSSDRRCKPEATTFCVDVDLGAWVEKRSCLRHAGALSLMGAQRSERRFLEDKVEDETQPLSSEAILSGNPRGIVGAREPEVSDAIETRTAMTQEKLNREGACTNTQTVRQSPRTFQNQILRGWLVALGVIAENLATSAEMDQRNAPKHLEVTLAYELLRVIWS